MVLKFALIYEAKQSRQGSFLYKWDVGPAFTDTLECTHCCEAAGMPMAKGMADREMLSLSIETDKMMGKKSIFKDGDGSSFHRSAAV